MKYKALLNGLEAVELKFSETKQENIFRIDSEHYQKKYLKVKEKLSKHNLVNLSTLVVTPISTGHTPSMKNEQYYGGSIKFIKTDNLRDNYIKDGFDHYLSELGNYEIKRTELQEDDVIVTIIGATQKIVGRSTKVTKGILPANINQNIALIRLDRNIINPDYVNVYFNSFYGKQYLYYLSRQTEQVNLNCEELGRVQVPIFSNIFQQEIESLVKLSYIKIEESKQKYKDAEVVLLKELDLLDFEPSNETVSVKLFSESFGTSGRLDSEYYQPKFDEVKKIAIKNADYVYQVQDIKTHNARGLQPVYVENGTLDVINSRHILDSRLDYENFQKTDMVYWSEQQKAQVYLNDILIYTTGANIGRTGIYLIDKPALASNHVNILRLNNESPVYVSFVLNSMIGRLQTEKLSAGSAQQELYPKDIDEFYIPFIKRQNQAKIEEMINNSFVLKEESKHLLDIAKSAVEIAIDQSEDIAMEFINEQV